MVCRRGGGGGRGNRLTAVYLPGPHLVPPFFRVVGLAPSSPLAWECHRCLLYYEIGKPGSSILVWYGLYSELIKHIGPCDLAEAKHSRPSSRSGILIGVLGGTGALKMSLFFSTIV